MVTTDLYCGAYLLSTGGALEEIKVDRGHRRRPSVLFVFSGEDVLARQREFSSGQAVVNLARFKASMIHLKDQMFGCLRERERGEDYGGFAGSASGA